MYDNKKLECYNRLLLFVYKYKIMSRVYWKNIKYKIMNILYWEKYNRVCLIFKSIEFFENKKRYKLKY